ncbi:MAG: amidohydrolase family protein, partial [Nitrospinae bacterium]|nr:amidohydrolase family protein [Nitrospinota bacterium]
HTHLDLTFLEGRLASAAPFTDWVRELVAIRRVTPVETLADGIARGVARLLATGTTAVGDICGAGLSARRLREGGLGGVVYHEVLGYRPAMREEALASLTARVESAPACERLRMGVSPHAVYSTSPGLMADAVAFARRFALPTAIHLVETVEEEQFTLTGTGPFAALIADLTGAPPLAHPEKRPAEVAQASGVLTGGLVIHGNHLSDDDIETVARERASVVWCPGSNLWFGRTPTHPVRGLRRAGVAVGLGTDSLASNDDLDMAREVRLAADAEGLPLTEAFRLATEEGGRALGMPPDSGTLRIGAPFDAVAVADPDPRDQTATLWNDIMAPDRIVRGVFINGALRFESGT